MSSPSKKPELPKCGIYRTQVPLTGKEDRVPAGCLVMFHNHSEQGPPLVLLPASNTNNRWTFHERGYLIEDQDFVDQLHGLPAEGLYVLREHVHISKEEMVPDKSLVQLGYNRDGQPILFVARFEGNTIRFPERGYRFNDEKVFDLLDPVAFRSPKPARVLH